MSGEETSFIQWRERSKGERKRSGGNAPLVIGVVVAVVVVVVVAAILLLH
jgi:hypothetical protein